MQELMKDKLVQTLREKDERTEQLIQQRKAREAERKNWHWVISWTGLSRGWYRQVPGLYSRRSEQASNGSCDPSQSGHCTF